MHKSGICPKCSSDRVIRYTSNYMCDVGLIRYLCTGCGFRETFVMDVAKLMKDEVVSWEWMRRPDEGVYR